MKKYIMNLTKLDDKVSYDKSKHIDKIGGHPTYLPAEGTEIFGYFIMEIYNKAPINGSEDILCWQLYQDEFGGPIVNVIEIPKGAKLNLERKIPIRRWIDEYIIDYEEVEESDCVDDEYSDENYDSYIGQTNDEMILDTCKDCNINFVGIIYEDLCPYCDLNLGYSYMIIGFDSDGKLVAM